MFKLTHSNKLLDDLYDLQKQKTCVDVKIVFDGGGEVWVHRPMFERAWWSQFLSDNSPSTVIIPDAIKEEMELFVWSIYGQFVRVPVIQKSNQIILWPP